MKPVYFNGKFYAGGLNGVHRVADRLIREFDEHLAATPPSERPETTLLCTRDASWVPQLRAIRIVRDDAPATQIWEQWRLPRLTKDGVLLNLANLAPLRHPRQVILIHDVQFLFPDSGYPVRQRLGYKWLVPRMARASARVFTVSEYSRKMLELMGVVDKDRTTVLHNGADHIHTAPAISGGATGARAFVLMFGSPKPYKNNAVVFNAFSGAALGDFDLVIVGSSREALVSAGLNPPEDAIFVGACNDEALRYLYENAHCLAFPSRTEGFGLPPVEAMLCGCPVVVAPAGAIPEVCRDAATYADVDNPESWRAAALALNDDSYRAAKVEAGRKRSAAFRWDLTGKRMFDEIMTMARL